MAELELTAIIHTRDSAATLARALESLAWVPDRLVIDMMSRDGTSEIAERLATRVLRIEPTPRVDGIRTRYVKEARYDWVLVLDSDEWLAADAPREIERLIRETGDRYDAISIPRFNYVGSQLMRGGLWYPDNQIRLFRKGKVLWSDSNHRMPEVIGGRLLELLPPDCIHIHHQNYKNLSEVIERQLRYAQTECYDRDPDRFSFAAYVTEAYERLALRSDPQTDGDLSEALALVMAWDAVIRGLIHWERLQPRPPLEMLTVLPPAGRDLSRARLALKRWTATRYPLLFHLRRVKRKFVAISNGLKHTLGKDL